jgi:hypothetical protein
MMDTELTFNDDDTFVIGVPLMKVDTEKRIVEGFATLNNVDKAGDLVESDASQEAFSEWIGNIREMHEKKAVGKAIDFYPETYTDPETGNTYEGMWVKAKISKGAEDTWQKVVDGTLAGFSIGGATLAKQKDFVKSSDGNSRQVWRITKYRLTELSLVDNPCNGMARISLVKSVDGITEVNDTIVSDMEKAYNGDTGDFTDLSSQMQAVVRAMESWRDAAIAAKDDSQAACASNCLSEMRSKARWESMDAEYQMNKSEEAAMAEEKVEKGADDSQENENSATSVLDELSVEDKGIIRKFLDFIKSDDAEVVAVENENKEKDGDTPDMNTEDVTKLIGDAGEELTKSVDEKFGQVGESLTKITALLEKVATTDAVDDLKKELEASVAEIAERVVALENGGAVQKSGEDNGASEKIEKADEGFWAGALLPDFAVGR